MWLNFFGQSNRDIQLNVAHFRVETKHRIARNLARIAQKFTRSTKIEIENARKKIARFLLGSEEDRTLYDRDRSDRIPNARNARLKIETKT